MRRLVTAQHTAQRSFASTSHGKWKCSDVTWLSGQALAKSMGWKVPSFLRLSQELKSQPKKGLMVRQESARHPRPGAAVRGGGARGRLHAGPVVRRGRRCVLDAVDLRPHADGAHEEVEGRDRRLQVHD